MSHCSRYTYLIEVLSQCRRYSHRVTELLERRREVQARYDAGQQPNWLPETKHVSRPALLLYAYVLMGSALCGLCVLWAGNPTGCS